MSDNDSTERFGTHFDAAALSQIAHDVRGPASVISGALDEIERAEEAGAAGPRASLFRMARRGVRRLLHIAERYSVASELARGSAPDLQDVDVAGLVQEAVEVTAFSSGRREIVLRTELGAAHVPVRVRWMKCAVADAVGLALRSARSEVTIQLLAKEGNVRVAVSNDGDFGALDWVWRAARATSPVSLDEEAVAVRVIDGVLRSHGGDARAVRDERGRASIELSWGGAS